MQLPPHDAPHHLPDSAWTPNGLVVTTLRAAWPHTLAIYAFGSRVHGPIHTESDLDLAILVAGYTSPLDRWEVASELANVLGCEVDLLDLRAASTIMQYQILDTGICLWAQQPKADLFECFVFNEKLDFDTARAPLLEDIMQRGRVYGK